MQIHIQVIVIVQVQEQAWIIERMIVQTFETTSVPYWLAVLLVLVAPTHLE